jgi:hypothetical protein
MSNPNIVDVLIGNIKEDKMLLNVLEARIEESKQEKQVIVNRLKEYRKDISVLLKYVDDNKKKELEDLGFNLSETEQKLNSIASTAYDIVMEAKGNEMTNEQLYNRYVESLKNKDQAVSYTEFNIKCRSLFNTQRLLRKKAGNPKTSREDIITLNGKISKSISKEHKTN